MTNREGKQCRERWRNNLDPNLKKLLWSAEEERVVREAHEKLGNKWAKIAKLMPGCSDNDVKNHFYAIQRRSRKRCPNDDGIYSKELRTTSMMQPGNIISKPIFSYPKKRKSAMR